MGSTITTGRVAAGVRTRQGRTLYLLFEESYSSNVTPHTPSWCCVGLGYLPAAMQRIFGLASDCESGGLRRRGGPLTPEGYIATWLEQLANPLVLHRTAVRLDVGDGFGSAIPPAKLDDAASILDGAGRPAEAATLRAEKVMTLDLVGDADAVLALQDGLDISPWRIVSTWAVAHRTGDRDPALGYVAVPCRAPTPEVPTALKLDANVRLVRDTEGAWRCGGWQYWIVSQHVQGLWRTELAFPGHHRKRISAFRAALADAPPAPTGLVVEIDGFGITEPYHAKAIQKLREQAGAGPGVFHLPLTDGNAWHLANLPRHCAKWLLPGECQVACMEQASIRF